MSRYEEVWKLIWTVMILLVLLVAVFSTAISSHLIVYDSKTADLGAISLGAATVILAGVAVIVGIGAIWGYREIREAIIKAALSHAETVSARVATDVTNSLVPRLVEARLGPEESEGTETTDLGSAFPRES
jgi:3-keto-L-gulonate-6-phosphate decarboxylase